MPQQKVYKRIEHEGEEHLLLSDRDILKEIDMSWVSDDADLRVVLEKLHEYISTGAQWFWIETGVPVKLQKKSTGFVWLVPDTRENSMKFQWLKNKVKKYEDRIVNTINEYNKGVAEFLYKEDQDGNAGTRESD